MQPLPGGYKGNKGLTSQCSLKSQSSIFILSSFLSYQLPLDMLRFVLVCNFLYPSCDYLGTLFSYPQYKKHLAFLRWNHLNIYAWYVLHRHVQTKFYIEIWKCRIWKETETMWLTCHLKQELAPQDTRPARYILTPLTVLHVLCWSLLSILPGHSILASLLL